jgi:SAM-dependent methyltransferase
MVPQRNSEIISYYNEWWDNPKDIRNVIFDRLYNHLESRLPDGHGKTALDIGLGRGKISALLLSKGYKVTSIDINKSFCDEFRKKYHNKVICADATKMDLAKLGTFDVVTCIELIPIIDPKDIPRLLIQIFYITKGRFYTNISNMDSLHGMWIKFKGYKNDFIHMDNVNSFRTLLRLIEFKTVYETGFGFITPISAFKGFKGKLIPIWFAKMAEPLDDVFKGYCHLYYFECEPWKI